MSCLVCKRILLNDSKYFFICNIDIENAELFLMLLNKNFVTLQFKIMEIW